MLREAGDAPGHKTVVSVLSRLFPGLCQNPLGLLPIAWSHCPVRLLFLRESLVRLL